MEIVIPVSYLATAATILGGVLLAWFAFRNWRVASKLAFELSYVRTERDTYLKLSQSYLGRLERQDVESKARLSPLDRFVLLIAGLPDRDMLRSLFIRLQATDLPNRWSVLSEYFRKNPSSQVSNEAALQLTELCADNQKHKIFISIRPKTGPPLPTSSDAVRRADAKGWVSTNSEVLVSGNPSPSLEEKLPPWDASKCSCGHPPHRPPCGYCESGNYSK